MRNGAFSAFTYFSLVALCAVLGCAAAEQPDLAGNGDNGGSGNSAGDPGSGGSGDRGGSSGSGGTGGSASGSGGTGATNTGGATTGGATTGGTGGTTAPMGGTGGTMPRPPGRPTIALPYTDDFETSMAADWRFISVPWTVTDDAGNQVLQLSATGDSETTWAVGGDRNWTDVRVEMRVKFVSGDPMILLSPRWANLDNYAFVEYEMEDKPKLRRRLNGSTADIITTEETMTFTAGQWHTVAVTLSGMMATLEIDGTVLGMGSDSTPVPSGGIAIAVENGIVVIDDVSVTAP
jgi:hypothetical protein